MTKATTAGSILASATILVILALLGFTITEVRAARNDAKHLQRELQILTGRTTRLPHVNTGVERVMRSTDICWTKNGRTYRTTVTTDCAGLTPAQCSAQHLEDVESQEQAIEKKGGTLVSCK